ncbi:MAG: Uma2 family endonuclease [Chloroflexi bacterium]|nr:Uma2 family endonuclease [Chloroflexota bacterium]
MQPTIEQTQPKIKTAPSPKMTYEEFLDWCDEDTLAEWVDGEIVMTSPASLEHQEISSLLETLLRFFVEEHNLGKVIRAPFQMKLKDSGREPDLVFVAKENLGRLHKTYLDGAADLAIEIISPESGTRDRGEKFYEYEAGGVREFWLIDPIRQQAEFYQLGENKLYQHVAPDASGVYRSKVVAGFGLKVNWLWEKPLKPTRDVLKEMGLTK